MLTAMIVLARMSALLPIIATLCLADSDLHFRPPAIPLFTTDPFMQTWIRGDNSTAASVTHWDGAKKEMSGMIRIDGVVYTFLRGSALPPQGATGGYQKGTDCGTDDLEPCGPTGCPMLESATPASCEAMCNNVSGCTGYVWTAKGCDQQSKDSNVCWLKGSGCHIVSQSCRNYQFIEDMNTTATVRQISVSAGPTRTNFVLDVGGMVQLTLSFVSSMFTDDYLYLSRPVYYVLHEIDVLDGKEHDVELYFDASAEHAINTPDQLVQWKLWTSDTLTGARIGSQAQNVLGSKGDRVNIDWGFLHMGTVKATTGRFMASSIGTGSLEASRRSFANSGVLPTSPDTRQPRAAGDDLPGLAQVTPIGTVRPGDRASHVVLLAYDDVESIFYFNTSFKAFWTQTYASIQDAMSAAVSDFEAVDAKSKTHDASLVANITAVGGAKYAAVSSLAYRQTLAATKLVWNHDRGVMWNFLKEISTNGDMQTMDVIFPASPMLLYTNPELLKLLLIPVLSYAANETYIQFTDAYSPHQLGTYPIGNDTAGQQEPMPLENSGNMFLMLLALVQRDPNHSTAWLEPTYWPMLVTWANDMQSKLPFPADQICTDDFEGRLANNTNLGAKGIVALQAFAELCAYVSVPGVNCSAYSATAVAYAKVWEAYATSSDDVAHYKISYNFNASSWSIKYNLLWQRLLKMDKPFPYDDIVTNTEVPYYLTKANAYGIPMDMRHTYVKTDWLSWAGAMSNDDSSFGIIMDFIFKFANETATRVPLTDLYDTITGEAARGGFIARPVMGGIFAKMLEQQKH